MNPEFFGSFAFAVAVVLGTWLLLGILAGPPIGRLLKRVGLELEDEDDE